MGSRRGSMCRHRGRLLVPALFAALLVLAPSSGRAQSCASPSFAFPFSGFGDPNATVGAFGDFDRNGKIDLAVVNQGSNSVTVYLGDGAGNFALSATINLAGLQPENVRVADLDRDGKLDLVI